MNTIDQQLFFLLEATVSLYPELTTGAADSGSVFTGAPAESLSTVERWVVQETRPTGAAYPKKHPLVQQYNITIARVKLLKSFQEFKPGSGRYVLDLLYVDEVTRDWMRYTFYGVTVSERNENSNEVFESKEGLSFDAEYYVFSSGAGAPPALTLTVPLYVRYVSTTKSMQLYSYDPATHTFTPTDPSILGTTATLSYDGSGNFKVVFGAFSPVLVTGPSGVTANDFEEGKVPKGPDAPRVEFWRGSNRVASVSGAGTVFAQGIAEGAPSAGSDRFELYSSAGLAATIGNAGVVATGING